MVLQISVCGGRGIERYREQRYRAEVGYRGRGHVLCVCVKGEGPNCVQKLLKGSLTSLTLTDGMSYAVAAAVYVTNSLTEQNLVNFLLAFNFCWQTKAGWQTLCFRDT